MDLKITSAAEDEIRNLRSLFLLEVNIQFIHNKCHQYAWADSWIFLLHDEKIGYGSVWGLDKREIKDCIFEFFLLPPYRKMATHIFEEFMITSGVGFLECQTNDPLLSLMLYEFGKNIQAEAILFRDHQQTLLSVPGVVFRKKDITSDHPEEVTGFILEFEGQEVASGGFFLNYNFPYADIYMDVKEGFFQRGFGSYIVQELKKEIYRMGRVPSARCNITNYISKSTLMKAGFVPCGTLVKAVARTDR
jgi:hypothetical protein